MAVESEGAIRQASLKVGTKRASEHPAKGNPERPVAASENYRKSKKRDVLEILAFF
jgi:hypothetical protein